MGKKSPFLIQKALVGIGGEPKSVKQLRSWDLLIETNSALQTKSFLLAKTFLDSPVNIIPHKSLNTSRGVISEPDLLTTPEAEILDGFSDQGVIQVRRITIKKDTAVIPTKHIILTFSSPSIPHTIKAGYLNCAKSVHAFRIICAVLSVRGSDTHKLPVAVNLLALDVHLLDMLPQIAV
ncbi:putative RNA-directed DNA polymerase from transposon BS [Trichonephila clavipes]|uniref:Putative RNA-directed DNA polymerase from transposon BS n=1 Tax=Trichonephila clavipes TaxID=2585209 RepID=A0A8X6RQT5_TRICX|nr:putative RNA-directed DNA polymerase from transposon BS [Trichonephila clavipes]